MALRRWFQILVIAWLVGLMAGCAAWRRPPFVSDEFFANPAWSQLAAAENRTAVYRQVFPPFEKIQAGGEIAARGMLFRNWSRFTYIAKDDNLFLRAYQPMGGRIFDVIVRDGTLTVVFGANRVLQGPIPAEGTPFQRHLGIEPWDLTKVFSIGQRIAQGRFQVEPKRRRIILTPADTPTTDGLQRIELDRKTGLPRRAVWDGAEGPWVIDYRKWKPVTDELSGQQRLLPTLIAIRGKNTSAPRLELTVDLYRYAGPVNPGRFTPMVDPPAVPRPLSELDELLRRI